MTNREREILNYIKDNPLITQQELADILGIERSSVAVHISNLTRKGIIKGKGYILQPAKYVIVIGGANMDILGAPDGELIMEDSNPGIITVSAGGVGRNIAENLAHLQVETKLLTAVGRDKYGDQLMECTSKAGIDTHYVRRMSEKSTSIYMSILDENKNMKVALSHMDITEDIDIPYIKDNSELIRQADFVLIDTNLSQEAIEYLFRHFPDSRFIVDTVSAAKSMKIKDYLNNIYCLKANRMEAGVIIDSELTDRKSLEEAVESLIGRGVRYPVISSGSGGIFYGSGEGTGYKPAIPVEVVNVNGAGDAFTAGITYGLYHNMTLEESVVCGQKAAVCALKSEDTVNRHLSINDLE